MPTQQNSSGGWWFSGTVTEVAREILPWAETALGEVQERARARTIGLGGPRKLLGAIEAGEPYGVFFDWGGGVARSYGYRAETSAFLGSFYRFGERVRVAMAVGRYDIHGYSEDNSVYRMAYYHLTGCSQPPKDEQLEALALVRPQWATALLRLDARRRNRARLEELGISRGLARAMLQAIPGEIYPSYLQYWRQEGQEVAVYRTNPLHWFFFGEEAYQLDREAGKLARRLLTRERRRGRGLLEAARMAVVTAGLCKF